MHPGSAPSNAGATISDDSSARHNIPMSARAKSALIAVWGWLLHIASRPVVIAAVLAALITGYFQLEIKKAETRSDERIEQIRGNTEKAIEAARSHEEQERRQRELDRALRLIDVELQQTTGHASFLGRLGRIPRGLSARSGTLMPSQAWKANRGILADELARQNPDQWDDILTHYLQLETYRTALATLSPNEPLTDVELQWAFFLCESAGTTRPLQLNRGGVSYSCFLGGDQSYDPYTDGPPSFAKLLGPQGGGEN